MKTEITKACIYCTSDFLTTNKMRLFCCRSCRDSVHWRRKAAKRNADSARKNSYTMEEMLLLGELLEDHAPSTILEAFNANLKPGRPKRSLKALKAIANRNGLSWRCQSNCWTGKKLTAEFGIRRHTIERWRRSGLHHKRLPNGYLSIRNSALKNFLTLHPEEWKKVPRAEALKQLFRDAAYNAQQRSREKDVRRVRDDAQRRAAANRQFPSHQKAMEKSKA